MRAQEQKQAGRIGAANLYDDLQTALDSTVSGEDSLAVQNRRGAVQRRLRKTATALAAGSLNEKAAMKFAVEQVGMLPDSLREHPAVLAWCDRISGDSAPPAPESEPAE